jgi:inner membrane protein
MIEEPKPQGIANWLQESVTVKLFFIGFLSLVLLIPSSMINSLISERAGRQEEVDKEVAESWSGSQLIEAPILVIPYKKQVEEKIADNKTTVTLKEVNDVIYILPNALHINAQLIPDTLHRGMFETIVYTAKLKIAGDFKPDLTALGIPLTKLDLAGAKLTFKVSDLKGLKTNPAIVSGGRTLSAQPVFGEKELLDGGLQAPIDLTGNALASIPFSYTFDIKGSQNISFLHTGKSTTVEVKSAWDTPSFTGRSSPDERVINKTGFSAKWHMLYYNRPFAQQWAGADTLLNAMGEKESAVFGVDLRTPVDQYQKTTRTGKYAVLIILLTFVALFLTEVIRKQRVHPFNYVLIGAALVIYYTLLLSFSEQVGYLAAYLIASVATITLVSIFIASLLKNKLMALLFAAILGMFYLFIYVLIQLEDLALLMGSVALFVILSLLMYFSRKINWDTH